jgi:phage regulator Rha-like protein
MATIIRIGKKMVCDDEYNALIKATEKIHELYYKQEDADMQFSNARNRAQNHLIALGLSRLVTANLTEIIYSLEDSTDEELVLLHRAAEAKAQVDATVLVAEESFRYASQRYEDCIKENAAPKKS